MQPLDVEFKSAGTTIRAHLYLPSGPGPHPVVVMAGGWCYVKELVQPAYARAFAGAGIAALVFDYRGFGTSDGEPRQHVDPWAQIEDYKNALSWVETRRELDPKALQVYRNLPGWSAGRGARRAGGEVSAGPRGNGAVSTSDFMVHSEDEVVPAHVPQSRGQRGLFFKDSSQ